MLRPDRLRAARVKRGLSQRELGRLCELGINQITRYELGISEPGSTILTTIAQQLGVSTDYLVGLSDDPHDYAEMPLRDDERQLLEAYASGNSITLMRLIADRLEKLAKSPDGDET